MLLEMALEGVKEDLQKLELAHANAKKTDQN
jgi:hypothetical protein